MGESGVNWLKPDKTFTVAYRDGIKWIDDFATLTDAGSMLRLKLEDGRSAALLFSDFDLASYFAESFGDSTLAAAVFTDDDSQLRSLLQLQGIGTHWIIFDAPGKSERGDKNGVIFPIQSIIDVLES